MMIAGFRLTKIVIIQSLEPHETKTGKILSEYISAQARMYHIDIPVIIINCSNSLDFMQILVGLQEEAITLGEIPLIHVECHGSEEEGLEFENGSTLSWSDLANALRTLNLSCHFNLLAVFSACFGGYFLKQMGTFAPAPCWCMVAPTDTVDPGEIMQAFRTFYSTLLRDMDLGKAITELHKINLSDGDWFGQPAELWFEKVVIGYIENHCTLSAIRDRVQEICQNRPTYGHHYKSSRIKKMLRQENSQQLLNKYFDQYFMIKELPENRHRFKAAKSRLKHKISELRKSGKYLL